MAAPGWGVHHAAADAPAANGWWALPELRVGEWGGGWGRPPGSIAGLNAPESLTGPANAARNHQGGPTFQSSPELRRTDVKVFAYRGRTRASLLRFPDPLRRGLAEAARRFDGDRPDKYARDGLIRLKDDITLLHRKPEGTAQSLAAPGAGRHAPQSVHQRHRDLRGMLGYRAQTPGRMGWAAVAVRHLPAQEPALCQVASGTLWSPSRRRALAASSGPGGSSLKPTSSAA